MLVRWPLYLPIIAIALAAPATAQEQTGAPAAQPPEAAEPAAEAPETPTAPWAVVCTGPTEASAEAAAGEDSAERGCVMTQRLSAKPDGPRLLQVYVRRLRPEETGEAQAGDTAAATDRMRIDLPFGLDLPAGIELRVDGEPWAKAAIRTCFASGCIAFVLLDEEAVTRLKRGGRMGVIGKTADGRVIGWPVSLAGFTAAHDQLEAKSQ
jgi:invasion protein IalB